MNEVDNKAIPTVDMNIGGKVRTIACTMFVLYKYQINTGKNPFKIALSTLTPVDMVEILTSALQQDEPDLSTEQVAKWMTTQHYKDLGILLRKLFNAASPDKDEDAESSDSDESSDTKKN